MGPRVTPDGDGEGCDAVLMGEPGAGFEHLWHLRRAHVHLVGTESLGPQRAVPWGPEHRTATVQTHALRHFLSRSVQGAG